MRIEVARVGFRRDVVFSDEGVAADEHGIPQDAASRGCNWPVALTLDVGHAWRSGYYEVVMEITAGEKVRRGYAFFVVRPVGTRIVLRMGRTSISAFMRVKARTAPGLAPCRM